MIFNLKTAVTSAGRFLFGWDLTKCSNGLVVISFLAMRCPFNRPAAIPLLKCMSEFSPYSLGCSTLKGLLSQCAYEKYFTIRPMYFLQVDGLSAGESSHKLS